MYLVLKRVTLQVSQILLNSSLQRAVFLKEINNANQNYIVNCYFIHIPGGQQCPMPQTVAKAAEDETKPIIKNNVENENAAPVDIFLRLLKY